MTTYEKYYKERSEILEQKILSLLYQADMNNDINALHENEYRKEVGTLRATNAIMKDLLKDFAEYGIRFDLTPTRMTTIKRHEVEADIFYMEYLKRINDSVKERAKSALKVKDGEIVE